MRKTNPEGTKPSQDICTWVWDTLQEISDEVSTTENKGYLLVYEGWGWLCVSDVFDPAKSDEENEEAYYEFAKEQSIEIIDEWIQKYKDLYYLVDCGHEPTGLYGVTWALFKKYNDKLITRSG